MSSHVNNKFQKKGLNMEVRLVDSRDYWGRVVQSPNYVRGINIGRTDFLGTGESDYCTSAGG